MSTPTSEHSAVINTWFHEFYAKGNTALLDELLAPGFVCYDPSNRVRALGPEGFKQWSDAYFATFSPTRWLIHDLISADEKAVVRYSGMTTYRGGFFDLPADQQSVKEMGMMIFHIRGGKVHELWTALCDLDIVLALGAVPVVQSNPQGLLAPLT